MILAPIVFLPLPLMYNSEVGRCAYVVLIMAVYWVAEVIPLAATALLPIALLPLLGIRASKDVCVNYLKDTNMLFVGGLIVAVAVERWNLHKRIALRVLVLVGSTPRWLMFGFMASTAFLSMWISNTATTAMMVPIAHAVLGELKAQRKSKPVDSHRIRESYIQCWYIHIIIYSEEEYQTELDREFTNMEKGLTLCVAYAANIGGSATLTGTGPNLVLKGQIDILYGASAGINFSSWFVVAFPNMLISLALAWFWLQFLFLGPSCFFKRSKPKDADSTNDVIRSEIKKMGPMSFAEKAVLAHFVILAVLWLTGEPEFVPGWADLPFLKKGYVTDASVAICVSISLFMFPSQRPTFLCYTGLSKPRPALLDWQTVQERMSWSVVILLGGGFALADACKASGLSQIIGEALRSLTSLPVWLLVFLLCLITAGITEITSNVATATIFLPIIAELAVGAGIHPLYLMIPVTISASFAFMLPVATPPNAIVFAFGNMRIVDMAKAGIVMNIVCIAVLQIAINSWGYAFYDLGTFPDWARPNVTASV
ncbi:hypothetical protein CAPTEDRAFT_162250 [Capitella teleta]|uniref:Citrate transporter-like domain-containing protein n=1 Tax=Capitella teleta TaxID=283909 RepID=R7TUG6_CAPTE|nr:hypothetical protein CAPTEDRAFT_162250 [Capitella teleta]|eukprot:ELT97227.1 hypothetical protein CAPTEDRAFT_162250 [Capitella teleta]